MTETAGQRENLMWYTARVLWQCYGQRLLKEPQWLTWCLFVTLDGMHSLGIGDAVLRIATGTPHTQRLPNSGVYERGTIESVPFMLIG